MYPRTTLSTAQRRFPEAAWTLIDGDHGELFVVSTRQGREVAWDQDKVIAVAAELVAVLAVQLRHVQATDIRLSTPSRAYVAVEAVAGEWVIADAFMRFDDQSTLPFRSPM